MEPKYYRLYHRQGKAEKIEEALKQSGYLPTKVMKNAALVLADSDQRNDMRIIQALNRKFFIYPHSARSMILWDGIIPPTSITQCNFVFSEGAKEVMKRYEYPRPVNVIGWTYCPIQEFCPSRSFQKVLFAPIHPNACMDKKGRRLMEHDIGLNRRTFQILRSLHLDITVRYTGDLLDNGLEELPDVKYEVSDLSIQGSIQSIQNGYDLIVGHQTFGYLSVACGKPTVMFGEDTPPHSMHVVVRNWERYKDILMFPLDLLKGKAVEVLEKAISTDHPIRKWKQMLIGEAFDPKTFMRTIQGYL